jgi:hypothetical protein
MVILWAMGLSMRGEDGCYDESFGLMIEKESGRRMAKVPAEGFSPS